MPTVAEFIAANWPAPDTLEEHPTWTGRSTFRAEFGADGSVLLRYGQKAQESVEKAELDQLVAYFPGALASAKDVQNQLEECEITDTRLSSYLCPILVRLGYAEREGDRQLRFKDLKAEA